MNSVQRILVFRLGSIGDFAISLPCLHFLRGHFAKAQIILLTNEPGASGIVPGHAVLQGAGLVDSYISYPGGTRAPRAWLRLMHEVRRAAPDILVYLAPSRSLAAAHRDFLFFRLCGIRHIIGLPATREQLICRPTAPGGDLCESEAHRLTRQLASVGRIDLSIAANWDLKLTPAELKEAEQVLAERFVPRFQKRLLALSIGTKQPVNNWGDANWNAVLTGLRDLDYGLVLVGGAQDRERSEVLGRGWSGPVNNLCGRLSPRVSAAVLARTRVLLCHDSGPMHLAAAVETPCVAVFSRLNPPGKWFPAGKQHRIFYPQATGATIASIEAGEVLSAARDILMADEIISRSPEQQVDEFRDIPADAGIE